MESVVRVVQNCVIAQKKTMSRQLSPGATCRPPPLPQGLENIKHKHKGRDMPFGERFATMGVLNNPPLILLDFWRDSKLRARPNSGAESAIWSFDSGILTNCLSKNTLSNSILHTRETQENEYR